MNRPEKLYSVYHKYGNLHSATRPRVLTALILDYGISFPDSTALKMGRLKVDEDLTVGAGDGIATIRRTR